MARPCAYAVAGVARDCDATQSYTTSRPSTTSSSPASRGLLVTEPSCQDARVGHAVDLALLAGCGLLLVAVLAVRLSSRTGVPALLVYLGIGVALGEAGLGIRFEDYDLTGEIGLVALAVILAEGGLTTRWSQVRPALGPAVVLST